mmetsp:Transcript_13564/g.15543  ORF Transcript_13564/g.15543 Transcript_13564/m.15543 type:complete len:389 (+) Transcript_13564:104-1270(+)
MSFVVSALERREESVLNTQVLTALAQTMFNPCSQMNQTSLKRTRPCRNPIACHYVGIQNYSDFSRWFQLMCWSLLVIFSTLLALLSQPRQGALAYRTTTTISHWSRRVSTPTPVDAPRHWDCGATFLVGRPNNRGGKRFCGSGHSTNLSPIRKKNNKLSKRRKKALSSDPDNMYPNYNAVELKQLCRGRKLKVSGKKSVLINRLLQYDETMAEMSSAGKKQMIESTVTNIATRRNKKNMSDENSVLRNTTKPEKSFFPSMKERQTVKFMITNSTTINEKKHTDKNNVTQQNTKKETEKNNDLKNDHQQLLYPAVLEVVLFGVGDLRIHDHQGLVTALMKKKNSISSNSSVEVLPLLIVEEESIRNIPGSSLHPYDTGEFHSSLDPELG